MRRLTELSAADWLVRAPVDPLRLITFGPAGFAAYARLRYIPDPDRPGMAESDAALPERHPSEIEQARTVLRALAGHTRTTRCYVCVWEGYGRSAHGPDVTDEPLVTLPHRRYALFGGDLGDLDRWEQVFGAAARTRRPRSSGRPTAAGASPATSTRTGPPSGRAPRRSAR